MKVIILNEPSYRAGGVESIYQFVDAINNAGGEGYIYFKNPYVGNPVPEEYKKYNIKIISKIEDIEDNIVFFPEVWTNEMSLVSKAKKGIWWLSVDNNHKAFQDFNNENILHLYQSEYAKNYLTKNGVKNLLPIHDYIEVLDFTPVAKKDIICYNPAKGKEATSYVLSKCSELTFRPLVNMTKEEIVKSLIESKIYIDFGHHPGRDRIPREAACYNSIVITSCLGSAKFQEDVPIPEWCKLKELNSSICDYLKDVLQNYEKYNTEFDLYRAKINQQKNNLLKETKELLSFLQNYGK